MLGKLFVIEGTDGSGKATQTNLLLDRLQAEGHKVATLDFPRYEGNVFGELIGECLAGRRGDFLKLDPRIASVLYAGDRFESRAELEQMLKESEIILLDRYISSNQIHQGGRIKDAAERAEFLEWLDHLEYELFGLPRPDATFFLDVPVDISMKLAQRAGSDGKKKYLTGKSDVYEASDEYNRSSWRHATELLSEQDGWYRIACADEEGLLSKESIHEVLYDLVNEFLHKSLPDTT